MNSRIKKNVIIAVTGSVATIKLPELIHQFLEHQTDFEFEIQVITTGHATHFFNTDEIPNQVKLYGDDDEWSMWTKRGDPVLHIELGKWADLMVIAPLDANTLAKMAQGICDNLLLCTTRAWNMEKPLFFCPAMNTRMWLHPITCQQIDTLTQWGHIEVACIEKELMCGDTGLGAMAKPADIFQQVLIYLKRQQNL